MKHDFIKKIPPKSTGKNDFGVDMLNEIIKHNQHLNKEDIIRTLVYFSAQTITQSINRIIDNKTYDFYINGGGKYHKILIDDIFSLLKNFNYKDLTDLSINPDFKEALLMSVLGTAKMLNINSNLPSVTGAKYSIVCGDKYE